MKKLAILTLALVALLAAMWPATVALRAKSDLRRYDLASLTAEDRGMVLFALSDWGGLSADTLRTNAVPWKLAEAALALHQAGGDPALAAALSTADIFRAYGFLVPDEIANWPADVPAPPAGQPLGLVRGQTGGFTPLSLEISNLGCAACHAAPVFDNQGRPDPTRAWLGGTNAALDLSGYTDALFTAFLQFGNTPEVLMSVVQTRFEDITLRERLTLRHMALPLLMDELRHRDKTTGGLLPFRPSHFGATNGYDSLRLRLGLIDLETPVAQSYFTSIPALGGRMWRSRFLANGVYALPGVAPNAPTLAVDLTDDRRDGISQIVSYFLVPSMGVTAEVAMDQHGDAHAVIDWMATYRPQPFPAAIDPPLAAQGQAIYAANCASCHGIYSTDASTPCLSSFPNWEGDVGTETGPPARLTLEVTQAISASPYAPFIATRPSTTRNAPPLGGLWASAPYLANGSVPTLWHLMRSDTRPSQFTIAGRALDFSRMGLAADIGPAQFDTTQPGFSNAGHTVGFDTLSEAEKTALLEFLKRL